MTRTQIGSATTNNCGVAVFDYTPSTEGNFNIVASDGDLESNHVSLLVASVSSLTVSSNKNILSYHDNDSALLTALYTENGSGVSGKTVEFTSNSAFETITIDEIISNNEFYTISSNKKYTIDLVTSRIEFIKNESVYLTIWNDGSTKFIGADGNIFLLGRDVVYVEYGVLKYYDSNDVLQSVTGYDLTGTVVSTPENTSDDVFSVYTVSDVTNASGEASCVYNSQGIGDVSINVKCMNVSETFAIQDIYKYDDASTDKSSTTFDSPLNIRNSSNYSVTHSDDCYLLYGSATSGAVGEFPIKALSSLTEYTLEFDSYTTVDGVNTGIAIGTNSRYAYIYLRSDRWHSWKTGNGRGSSPSESSFDINGTTNSVWTHYVITRNGYDLNLKAYVNGSQLCNQSVTINSSVSNTYQGLAYAYGGNSNIKVKNIKIKLL